MVPILLSKRLYRFQRLHRLQKYPHLNRFSPTRVQSLENFSEREIDDMLWNCKDFITQIAFDGNLPSLNNA